MKILVIDVGGSHIKFVATDHTEPRRFESGPTLTAQQMVDGVREATHDWEYDVVSIGYPGPVVDHKPLLEPRNLGGGWVDCDFAASFGKPVRIINDAAMQALGNYTSGRLLFLGLGTGLGSAMILDRVIAPMELAHLPYKKGQTFEDYVGLRGLKRLGKKKWRRAVADVVSQLKNALVAHEVVLGGGNAKHLKEPLPDGSRLGANEKAFAGGFRLWTDY